MPDRLLTGALALASVATDALPLGVLPRVRRVLVVAPHPDDESIGCGGTLARWASAGVEVSGLLVSDGEATIGPGLPAATIAARRRQEAREAARALGIPPPVALGLPDGRLPRFHDRMVAAVAELTAASPPDVVLTPWPLERHDDHRAVTRAVLAALPHHDAVWGYEAHTPITQPTHVIDITTALPAKRAALRAHVTAGTAFALEAAIDLARWRSLATRAGRGAAEAFLALPADAHQPLLAAGDALWTPTSGAGLAALAGHDPLVGRPPPMHDGTGRDALP